MASQYPAQIDNSISLPPTIDNLTPVVGAVVNRLRTAIINTQTELGIKPSGIYGTVRARLDALEGAVGSPISFGGDLSGTHTSQIVIGLQGVPISAIPPTSGQVLEYNGSTYVPTTIATTLAGDVTGPTGSNTVVKIQNIPVSATVPTINQLLEYNGSVWIPTTFNTALSGDITGSIGSNSLSKIHGVTLAPTSPTQSVVIVYDTSGAQYDIRQLTEDDILPGFSISSFSGGSVVECGVTVTNPAFTASYSSTPTSAQITNTDGVDSPLVLSPPYTSGTVVGTFHHTTVNFSVTFTLTAVKGVTKTANQFITYEARSFGGVGSAGATSSVTASGNNAILSTADTLNNEGLHASDVGQSYGLFSPSGQKIYLLLQGGSHTFRDQNGFTFPMNSPTAVSFTNQHGAVISMFLYESTNVLSTPFTITVVS